MQTSSTAFSNEHIGPIYVVGHKNPDTDTVVSAIGYAWLLRERDKLDAQPARAGQLNPQTSFALRTFKVEPPAVLADASPRFGSVARAIEPLTPDRPLQEAWALVARTGRVAPVVDGERRPIGLITGASVFNFLSAHAGQVQESPDALNQMPFGQVLAMPCGRAGEADVPRFDAGARIKDSLPRILRDERDTFWVVEDNDCYVGVCFKADLLRPPRLRLILIDHNETTQAISGLDEAELLEVLDHHRLANPPTHMPIAFHVDPVGSSSTLVAERAMRSGLAVPRSIAGALLSGLLSDTLVLKSPTTTARDRVAAVQLATWAFPDQADPYRAMLDYGWQLLQAGAGLESRSIESIVSGDYKEYDAAGLHFGVAQVEVTDLLEIEARLDDVRAALCDMEKNRNLHFAGLLVTDIVGGTSRLLLCGDSHYLDGLPYARRADGTFEMPGVLSRKKQLLPAILSALQS
jgi:manganese-dependent inorganic pyrophosphatase